MVIDNPKKETTDSEYLVIHYRIEDGQYIEINHWDESCLWHKNYFKHNERVPLVLDDCVLIPSPFILAHLYERLYNYKNGKFVIDEGVWDSLYFIPYDYLHYNCIYGGFSLNSLSKSLEFAYIDPFSSLEQQKSFYIKYMKHFGVLNLDGTIRDNKIFIGTDLTNLKEMVDLNNYSSLKEYKKEIILEMEKRKEQIRENRHASLQNVTAASFKSDSDCKQELNAVLSKKY